MDVKRTLEQLTPETSQLPHWDAVVRDARPSRARWAAPRLAVLGTVLGLAALLAVAPWQSGERAGVLDRALAAVGDGSVLHVVFRGEWGGTLVDLETGRRTPAYGEREVWYDPDRGLVHQITRFGGVVEHEVLYERNKEDRELTALWQHYRDALADGTARVIGQDVVNGVSVYWLIVHSQMLPDVADGKDHEFAQQVAISRETFKPVAMRYTRDRKAPEGATEHILRFETVSVDEADFTSPAESSLSWGPFRSGQVPISLDQAVDAVGRTPYWLGKRYEGLPLAQVARLKVAAGSRSRRLLRGPKAAKAKRCFAAIRRIGGKEARRSGVCRSLPHPIEGHGDNVYLLGPVEWGPEQSGLVLFYGTLGDNPTTFSKDSTPRLDQPHVSITETASREVLLRGAPMRYEPPPGAVVVSHRRFGYLVLGGVHISIEAENEATVLAAARALRPIE